MASRANCPTARRWRRRSPGCPPWPAAWRPPSTATSCPAVPGPPLRCVTAIRSRWSRPCKEVELMTDTEVLSQAAPWTPADPWVLAGRELASRLILGTGGVQSLDVLRRVLDASGTALTTVAMRRVSSAGDGAGTLLG